MKRALYTSVLLLFVISANAQISISTSAGGSMKFDEIINPINKGSTLVREYITLNDETCPLRIHPNVGVEPRSGTYDGYWFTATGNIFPLQPIAAYEIHHIIYDVFGHYIKSLSNIEITDLESPKSITRDGWFERFPAWNITTREAMVYCYCVSYVANVRTMEGEIWEFNLSNIMLELDNNQIPYEEDYLPVFPIKPTTEI